MRVALLVLNFLLMIALPVILGWFIARRRHISWRYFGIGAATFVLAQLAHIPFNYFVINNFLAEAELESQSATLLVSAVFLGLSAGIFEEGARYLSYRFWATDARTWGKGLMMGAGHGGAESILLGVLGALNVTILLGYRAGYFQGLVPAEQAPQVDAVRASLFKFGRRQSQCISCISCRMPQLLPRTYFPLCVVVARICWEKCS